MKHRTTKTTCFSLFILVLMLGGRLSTSAQTYAGELSQTCAAFTNREATFEDTPFVTEDVIVEMEWVYCGPWNGNDNGHFYVDIWVDGAWQDLFDVTDNGNGCSWVPTSHTVSSSLWNEAIASNDGSVLIRGYITDSCSPGVGCNFFSDPCFRGAVEYDFEPIESAVANFTVASESVCVGEEITIDNLSTGSGLEYDWDFGPGVEVVSSSDEQYVVRYTTEGTKTISLTAGNILGDSNFTFDLMVNPLPTVSISDPASICEGETTPISAVSDDSIMWNFDLGSSLSIEVSPSQTTTYVVTAMNGFQCSAGFDESICFGESYTLSGSGDGAISWGILGENEGEVTVVPDETTVYTLTSTGGNGCLAEDQVVITVNEIPDGDAGENQTICDGESAELNATGGVEYQWEEIGSGATQTVSPMGTTTYTVTVINEANCSFVDQVTVSVNPSPEISISENTSICAGESVSIEANSEDEIEWNQELGSESIINVTPSETTTYIATATNEFQCSVEAVMTVEVLNLPEVNAGEDVAICVGETVTLTGNGEGLLFWGEDEESGAEIIEIPAETDTYMLNAIGENGCQSSDLITVTVNSLPVADAGMDQAICEGEDVELMASGGMEYNWDNGLGSGDSHIVNPFETITYVVTVTNAANCVDTDEVTITVNPYPEIEV
ncbi:MAG: PKD domain-containing protein, partial [Flavobacteriales bacterium]|nr:PKD domain-containing protein [Flavobacteriales bacterium]